MSTDREKCLEAGCTGYETKPVQRDRLLATCQRLIASERPRPPFPSGERSSSAR
jgi:CheY-like chemotaxis protein